MPLAPSIAAALTDHGARTRALFVDGLDVLFEPGTGTRFGVPVESVTVTEMGPGAVSSCVFTIEDPGIEITVARGQEIRFVDLVQDRTIFRGLVASWSYRPFGLGRAIIVRGVGIEAVLDWMIVPSLTLATGLGLVDAVQSVVAAATGIGVPLRDGHDGSAGAGAAGERGSQEFPVGSLSLGGSQTLGRDVTLAGQTLREALRIVFDAMIGSEIEWLGQATVDFDLGLRVFPVDSLGPSDYAFLVVNDIAAGSLQGADPEYETDAIGVPAAVYVTGGNANATGLVSRADGIPGPVARLNDPSLLQSSERNAAGRAYLARFATVIRSRVRRETITWSSNQRAGSLGQVTDVQLGLSSASITVASITKSFHGGMLETWDIALGGTRPSAVRELRRLTSDIVI